MLFITIYTQIFSTVYILVTKFYNITTEHCNSSSESHYWLLHYTCSMYFWIISILKEGWLFWTRTLYEWCTDPFIPYCFPYFLFLSSLPSLPPSPSLISSCSLCTLTSTCELSQKKKKTVPWNNNVNVELILYSVFII